LLAILMASKKQAALALRNRDDRLFFARYIGLRPKG